MLGKLFSRGRSGADGAASVPDGKRIYAIGDIHGRLDMLDTLLGRIGDDSDGLDKAQLIFLGDYVDRGLDSKGVIDRLLSLKAAYPTAVFLKGNHEALMLDFLDEPDDLPQWLDWGGMETLQSYDVEAMGLPPTMIARQLRANLPPGHLKFLETLALTHVEGDYLFVHAGVRPGLPLDQQKEEDLIWIRKKFHQAAPDERPELVVVHGHTPEDKPVDVGWRIGVDTGACYGGMLTAVVLHGAERRFISVKN
ncbi:MAG: metallophosphoesterase family protein [Parvularculaceae bacterium]